MALWSEIARRVAWLGRRSRFERELEEEMQFHIESRTEELEQEGVSRAEALSKAQREFGSSLRARELRAPPGSSIGSRTCAATCATPRGPSAGIRPSL